VRHVRMLGLCMVAVLAVAAYAASSASAALPEFGQCLAKEGGKYSNSGCTVKAKKGGTFEWTSASKIASEKRHFVGVGGAGVLDGIYTICSSEKVREQSCKEGETERFFLSEPGKPLKIECESELNTGEISGSNTVAHIAVIFRGCKVLGTAPCSNTEHEGEIQVNELKGKIGFTDKSAATPEVGLLLEPNVKKGEFAKFSCLGGAIGTVVGQGSKSEGCAYPQSHCGGDQIIGSVAPVNTETKTLTQTFTANEETAENTPSKLEGKPISLLESYVFNTENPEFTTKWSKAGESVVNVAHACAKGDVSIEECEAEPEEGEVKASA
jgi:hypothetical protein